MPVNAPAPARSQLQETPKLAAGPLRYYISTAIFGVLYLVILIVPWVVVCVLDVKPMGGRGRSYFDGSHGKYSQRDIDNVGRWMRAIRCLNLLAAVAAVPLVFRVISHATVVLMQKRKDGQVLSLYTLFSLADLPRIKHRRSIEGFMWAGIGIIVIFAIQPLIQAALVTSTAVRVASCSDVPNGEGNHDLRVCHYEYEGRYSFVGYDPEPADLAILPVGYVNRNLRPLLTQLSLPDVGANSFASAIPVTTSTGVLRYLAVAQNSSLQCQPIERANFPDSCPGKNPLELNYTSHNVTIRLCAPGMKNESLWAVNRRQQNITEEFFLDVSSPTGSEVATWSTVGNFSIHCAANTTRGYFELPNYFNNNTAGSILTEWPDNNTMRDQFNDRTTYLSIPLDIDNETSSSLRYIDDFFLFREEENAMPGPLFAFLMAALGNGTWFNIAQNALLQPEEQQQNIFLSLCSQGLPMRANMGYVDSQCSTGIAGYPGYGTLDGLVYTWFSYFNPETSDQSHQRPKPEDILRPALLATNQAILQAAAQVTAGDNARVISSAAGTLVTKPVVSLATKIVISTLIGLQVIALTMLMIFIYSVPTFSSHLDAASLVLLGTQLKDVIGAELPRLGLVDVAAMDKLKRVNATVGIERSPAIEMVSMPAPRRDSNTTLNEGANYAADQSSAVVNEAMSEVTVAVRDPVSISAYRALHLSEQNQPFIVSAMGTGVISRKARMQQQRRQDSSV